MQRRQTSFFSGENIRFILMGGVLLLLFGAVLARLFVLQIINAEELQQQAKEKRNSTTEVTAKRGNIIVLDKKTGGEAKLAINTTLYKVFVDAREIVTKEKNFPAIATVLTDTLYTLDQHKKCLEDSNYCPENSLQQIKNDDEEVIHTTFPTYAKAKEIFKSNILKNVSTKRTSIIYATDVSNEIVEQVISLNVLGLFASSEKNNITIDLETLDEPGRKRIAELMAKFFGGKAVDIAEKLHVSRKGYVPILGRVDPDKVAQLKVIKEEDRKIYLQELSVYAKRKKRGEENVPPPDPPVFQGIGFTEEPLRYYPEGSLAANIIGFVNNAGVGQYGIEKRLDATLKGANGRIEASRDIHGNALTIEKNSSEQVEDGADIVLTIDRIVQKDIELLLDTKVKDYKADSGQIIIIDPQSGNIIAMVDSPRYNPNFFGEVYARKKVQPEDYENIYTTTPLEKKDREGNFVPVKYDEFVEQWSIQEDPEFYMFSNIAGPAAYTNKSTMAIYEPGSVAKPLVMAAALEEGEINPTSRYFESKPLKVGEFTIRNADKAYLGSQTMTNIMERSANVGMSFIAIKMGKQLMYTALKSFGFGEYTDVILPDELSGTVSYHKKWSKAQMLNASFGQGFSATPLQVITAWTALANGGFLVSPHIIQEIRYPDGRIETPKQERKRILSSQTVRAMNTILVSSVENGVAKKARMNNHYIAGKTGTSQIARTDGVGYEDLNDIGSTITGFIGYAPVDEPKFLVLVKFDRPRVGQNGLAVFGSSTAAPTFKNVMEYLFEYHDTPRDKF